MATKALATWALALQFGNLTEPIADIAVKSVYNWAGYAIGGYALPPAGIAYEANVPFIGAQANSSIFGTGEYVDVKTAALINGIASHADDYEDTHRDNPIHPSGPVLSALFAVAEWMVPVLGEDFLAAFVAGVEAECKIDITSTVGSVGSAVAVGKLLGLDTKQMQRAISIASVQVIGMHESFGTDTKPSHVGAAAQAGLQSALLAKSGFGGFLEGLEAQRGWSHVVSTRENLTAEISTLGKVWEISRNTFKPYPYDRIIHAAIDGWIQIHDKAVKDGLDLTKIANVTARTHPRVLFLTDDPKPKTGLQGKFSVYHAAAIALLFGEATPTQFTDEAVQNKAVIELRQKVNVTSDEKVSEHEAFVAVEFENGKKLEVHVEHTIGSYENPLNEKFLHTKFLDHVGNQIGDVRAKKALGAFAGIANMTDVGQISQQFKK
ncbi:immune-responsive 1 [Fusarium circinatum]|uniref:Immune-responsive 1 n=1 Tax=Fusarium circinatum TaxID=48490 RepID=A0A8H5X3R2_FUSCI|nr:immune-responsive 1 [Fusarium circinatum]